MPRDVPSIDDTSRQVLCERCRKFVPVSSIKYIPRGNDARIAMCAPCLAKANGEAAKKTSGLGEVDKPSYTCTRCRYKFKYDPHKNASLRCPYCGKSDRLAEDRLTTADSILKETLEF